jgi:two-component system NtrC family sensor kinase
VQPPFDVVLCDLMMPEIGGDGVYEAVRGMRAGAEEIIVFMSGGAFTSRAAEFLASVPNRCLEKPFLLDDLLGAVEGRR